MTNYRSLNHTKWACQYHVVFIPKYRKKAIYGELRGYLGEVLRRLAQQRARWKKGINGTGRARWKKGINGTGKMKRDPAAR